MKSNTPMAASTNTPFISTLRYLPIAEIHDDMLILKDGSARAILEVANINFDLKSEEEQSAIIYSYQHFLNSLEFPIQISLTSRKLDIEGYVEQLRGLIKDQTNPLIQGQTVDYITFIMKFIEFADIMERKSYIVIPVDKIGTSSVRKSIFSQFWEHLHPDDDTMKFKQRLRDFALLKKSLLQRVNVVKAGIESCSLSSRLLETKDLIALFYQTYNPTLSFDQKIREMNLTSAPKMQSSKKD